MEELLIVNPARRPSRRRNPSPAQKRARAAFAAMARARAKNPRKRRAARRRHNPMTLDATPSRYAPAPKMTGLVYKRRRNPAKRRAVHHRRRRHNPLNIGGGSMKPMHLLGNALVGAVGATVVNTALSKLPIPAVAMTGKMRYATQAVAAIGIGMLLSKVGPTKKYAAQMAEGSLTVTLHDLIKEVAAGAGMNLGGMGYYLPGVGVQAVPSASGNPGRMAGMGKYLTGPGAPMRGSVTPINRMAGLSVPRKGMSF